VSLVAWLFAAGEGWNGLLADGDTGWHIRTGDYILQAGSVPTVDIFSFSKPGEPWFAWEWLSDVIIAGLHRMCGLPGVVGFTGLVIALSALVVFRQSLWRGANSFAALGVTLVATGAASLHFLARPHVFTLLLLPVALWLVERDRRAPGPGVWALVPLSALWANLHGGFLALIACLGILAVGSAVEAWLAPERNWRPAWRYAGLTAACTAATLLNPYGFRLHTHIASYLRSDWIREAVDEFQSPKFRSENIFQFEAILFVALLLAGILLSKRRICDALPILVWAHLSLSSVRHVPVFAVVVSPLVAQELTRIWEGWSADSPRKSVTGILWALARDLTPGFQRNTAWSVVLLVAVLVLTPVAKWPRDFPAAKFPVKLVGTEEERLAKARVFTSDEWADYLIYRGWPHQKVFLDGRSDFYGPALGREYIQLVEGRPGWRKLLEKHKVNAVLANRNWPLTALLRAERSWQVTLEDRQAVLFVQTQTANQTAPRHR